MPCSSMLEGRNSVFIHMGVPLRVCRGEAGGRLTYIATAQTSDRDFEPGPIVEIDVLISLSNPIGIRGWTLPQKKARTNISTYMFFLYTTHVIVELQLIEVLSSDVWPLEDALNSPSVRTTSCSCVETLVKTKISSERHKVLLSSFADAV